MQKDNDILLLKGNEAIAHAAIRYGYDGFFGYPITPQSEILETLALLKPWETTGMVVLQSESEVASINMIYAGGGSGKCVLTSAVCEYLCICDKTLQRLRAAGKVAYSCAGNKYYYQIAEIKRCLKAHIIKSSDEMLDDLIQRSGYNPRR